MTGIKRRRSDNDPSGFGIHPSSDPPNPFWASILRVGTSARFWRTFAFAWALGVIYFTTQDFFYLPAQRPHVGHLLYLNAIQVAVWAVLVLPAFAFLRRWPLDGDHRVLRWSLFTPIVLALVSVGLWAAFIISLLSEGKPWAVISTDFWPHFGRFFTLYFHFYFLTFLSVLLVYHAAVWRRRFRDRELLTSQLEANLFQAQNQALRMQLQPHFLFNTLHSIATLMHTDVEAADRMVARLGDLLRKSLERNGDQEIRLDQELEFLGAYLEIEQVRFQDRLRVSLEIADEVRAALLPTFILQPLVENALKHGFARRSQGGRVAIRAWREAETLRLEVQDDGDGPPTHHREGIGLASVRNRVRLLYGDQASFAFQGLPQRGALAALTLPLRFSASPSEEAP